MYIFALVPRTFYWQFKKKKEVIITQSHLTQNINAVVVIIQYLLGILATDVS